jgi:hypothetical protein
MSIIALHRALSASLSHIRVHCKQLPNVSGVATANDIGCSWKIPTRPANRIAVPALLLTILAMMQDARTPLGSNSV